MCRGHAPSQKMALASGLIPILLILERVSTKAGPLAEDALAALTLNNPNVEHAVTEAQTRRNKKRRS